MAESGAISWGGGQSPPARGSGECCNVNSLCGACGEALAANAFLGMKKPWKCYLRFLQQRRHSRPDRTPSSEVQADQMPEPS